ncbi:MAG: hypothetical protein JXB62_22545 [Pirellulales bacterium]|nr:hypothetical protein [Pirellulales bacterium]
MPLDAYSLCPGGTGKKIKFCCPDFLSELQKIDRMLEGQQNLACLQYIDRLEKEHPDRACLLAIKIMLLRASGQKDEVNHTVATFLEKHPENTTAMAESAIQQAFQHNADEAVALLQRAISASSEGMQPRVYEALGTVAEILVRDGEWAAGRAMLQLQMAIGGEDERPVEMLLAMNQAPNVPLLFKDDPPLAECPDDAPWKARFEEAMAPTRRGDWQGAAEQLGALAREVDGAPAVWRNLATLRGWLADRSGCIEALRKLASLDIPLEEAVEAEALAMLSSDDPLGDPLPMQNLLWEVQEVEHAQAALTMDPRALQTPFDPAMFGSDENPPPRAAYLLLDRPIPDSAEEVTWEDLSRVLGQAMLYGRQIDREARLEVIGVTASDVESLKALLCEIVAEALAGDVQEAAMGETSASQELLHRKWRPPNDISPQKLETLAEEHRRNALLKRWPELKLGVLDGKSPREAAEDEAYRIKLLATVMVLECWIERVPGTFDFNELRSELGLPTVEPIDPDLKPVDSLPLVRLQRVMAEKLSDDVLVGAFRRAVAFGISAAMRKFAQAVVDRPSLAGDENQLQAYSALAQMESDPGVALAYLEQGREAAQSAGHSCAPWDLLELRLRFGRHEVQDVQRLVQHLQAQHIQEPGVAEALMRFLVQIGVIRPDGTPAGPTPSMEGSVPAEAGQPPAESGGTSGIWTPGGEQADGRKKIWTPD